MVYTKSQYVRCGATNDYYDKNVWRILNGEVLYI